jgi:hypothetical protein
MSDKSHVRESKMSVAYVKEAKGMADYLLSREHRGLGDTIEAAAYRTEAKYRVPASFLLRLRNRPVNDMLVSNFMALAAGYRKATQAVDRAYEHEKSLAVNPTILRLAALVAGEEDET